MRHSSLHLFLLSLLGVVASGSIAAQTQIPPTADPAQIQRQREELERLRDQRQVTPTAPKLTAPQPEPDASAPVGPSFVLRRVEFTPTHLLSKALLDSVVADSLGESQTIADVRALAQRINALYFERGHITARAFVPSQKIVDGVLQVRLIEASLAGIETPQHSRLSKAFLESLIDTPVGELIFVPRIDRRLERLHRNTDVRVALDFTPAPGDLAGQSIIKVRVDEPPFWTARASLSNEGSDSVGREQLSLNATLNNLLGRTDKINLIAIASKGSSSVNLQYSLPLPGRFMSYGTRLTAGLSHGKTQATSPGFETVKLDGIADSYSIALAQPLWTSGPWSLDAGASLNGSHSTTDIAQERFSNVNTHSLGLTATLMRVSNGSALSATLSANKASTTAIDVAARATSVAQLSLLGQKEIAENWWVQGRAGMQFSGDIQLPSSLQFQIGGPGNVRGYESPTASGDQGNTASLELHRLFAGRFDSFVFVDQGSTRTEGGNSTQLASAGLGLTWTAERWSVSVAAASPRREIAGQDMGVRMLLRASFELEKLWR